MRGYINAGLVPETRVPGRFALKMQSEIRLHGDVGGQTAKYPGGR